MVGRLEYERAIRRSDLPAPSRHLALTIATWADMDTGAIPERFQPSLSTLEEATGLSRKTVRTHLDTLESGGWLLRDRPDVKKARTEHAQTRYVLLLPLGARGGDPLGLGAEIPQPRGGDPLGKGQRSPRARGRDPLKSPYESQKTYEDAPNDDVEAICTHLADVLEKTGSKRPEITKKWRDAARLLVDKDGITPKQAIAAIDWAHSSDFWQALILTPMKLRERYDTLRRQAAAEQRKATNGRQRRGGAAGPLPTADEILNTPDEDVL